MIIDQWQSSSIPWSTVPATPTPTKFPSEYINTATARWKAFQQALMLIKYASSPPVLAPGRGGYFINQVAKLKVLDNA